MPKSTNTCNSILALMYNATTWPNVAINATASPITSVEIALHSTTPLAATDNQQENETTYPDYARIATNRATGTGGWSAPSGGQTSNVGLLQGVKCGTTVSTFPCAYVSTGMSHTGASKVWHFGQLNSALAVAQNITPQFPNGNLVIQET